MKVLPRYVAWLVALAVLISPAYGLCGAGPTPGAGGCAMDEDAPNCECDHSCGSTHDEHGDSQPTDGCPEVESAPKPTITTPRLNVTEQPLPSPFLFALPAAFQPESARKARLNQASHYQPTIPPHAHTPPLAQGCALNT